MLFPYMPTAPHHGTRRSSPLNPHTSSSPPMSTSFGTRQQSSPTPMTQHKTRYTRPDAKKYVNAAPTELFTEGTTPTEGLMWRERYSRRMEERERRKKSRDAEVDRRRGPAVEEQDEAKMLEDDEEIFRRLMVLQRKREQRNAQISYEMDNGGSDPISPDFWDGEEECDQDLQDAQEAELERQLQARLQQNAGGPSNYQTPQRPRAPLRQRERIVGEGIEEEDEDQWAAEAARAEEVERQREAEEAELAERVEASHRMQNNDNHDQDTSIEIDDIGMDWDVDMDF